MKEGWEYRCLGEVCELYQPKTISTKDLVADGEYNVFGANGIIGKYNQYNHENSEILMTCRGATCGNINISTPKSWINGNAMVIHIKNESLLHKAFLVHALTFIDKKNIITGAAQPQITRQTLSPLVIAFPSLHEQQSIVDYLDSAFAKIDAMKANAEEALNEAKALFQASLKEKLEPKEGWEKKKLGDIGELKNGMNFSKNESGYNVHILGVGDFGNLFQIDNTDYLQTISLNSEPSEEYILKNKDIVFVRSNGNKNLVGRCVLIHVGNEPCSFSGFCIRLRKSTNEVDACYLAHFLKTEGARRKLVGNGANISNLNQKILSEFVVSYPSIQEQQSIVDTLDSLKSKVDKLQENYDKISQECDALKQAILRQVFE